MITEKTRNIVIESAWWDPGIVRKMSRRHGLHTDASHRFERGADFESTVLSCDLVAQMILESGGGELVGDAVDVVSRSMDQAPVVLHVSEVRRILGDNLDAGQIFRLLKRLGFILIPEGQDDAQFRVTYSQLAAGCRARDRCDRRDRAPARLRQIREHAAGLQRRGGGIAATPKWMRLSERGLWRWDTTKLCR